MGPILPITREEKEDLKSLAATALEADLGSNLFPLFVHSLQNDTGVEPTGAVKRLAARIDEIDKRGILLRPKKIASILRWYARGGRPDVSL